MTSEQATPSLAPDVPDVAPEKIDKSALSLSEPERAGVTNRTSGSWPPSHVVCVAIQATRTICDLRSRRHWASKSTMSSPPLCRAITSNASGRP